MTRARLEIAAAEKARHAGDAQKLAEQQLRAASVRITATRVEVLAALLNARCAVSHQDIQDLLTGMDRVTLYRALDCLTDARLAHKIAGDDRIYRYSAGTELAKHGDRSHPRQDANWHQHGHFKCTRCARVFCLDGSRDGLAGSAGESDSCQTTLRRQMQALLQEALGKGFRGHDIDLTIKGWCADCTH